MKTAGYTLILLGLIILSLGIRGRRLENLPTDIRDLSVALSTADVDEVSEIINRKDDRSISVAAFQAAQQSLQDRIANGQAALGGAVGTGVTGAASTAVSGAFADGIPAMSGTRNVQDLIAVGRVLQKAGFSCNENKALGDNPRPGVHMASGYHYKFDNSGAIDVNWPNSSQEPAKMDELAPILRRAGFHVLWRVKGHYNHLHVDISRRDI